MESKSRLDRWIFKLYFPNYEKLKSFKETFTPYNQIFTFEEQLGTCMCNFNFYIWHWHRQWCRGKFSGSFCWFAQIFEASIIPHWLIPIGLKSRGNVLTKFANNFSKCCLCYCVDAERSHHVFSSKTKNVSINTANKKKTNQRYIHCRIKSTVLPLNIFLYCSHNNKSFQHARSQYGISKTWVMLEKKCQRRRILTSGVNIHIALLQQKNFKI
jgi:hypothetical protein